VFRRDLPNVASSPDRVAATLNEMVVLAHVSTAAQSRRLGLGTGYHGTLSEAMDHDRDARPESTDDHTETTHTVAVPDDVRTVIRDAFGVDTGDQQIHRDPTVSDEARQLGAVAFTRDGQVFLPVEAGPLDQTPAKSLLAHELTHLVQQRQRGSPLPADGSGEALSLEHEAQITERFVRGDAGAPSPGPTALPVPPDARVQDLVETHQFLSELVHRGVAEPDGEGGVRFLWGQGGGSPAQRAVTPAEPVTPTPVSPGVGARLWGNLDDTFGADLRERFEGEYGISLPDSTGPVVQPVDAAARHADRALAKEAFQRTRLEHLRSQKQAEATGGVLSEADEHAIKEAVTREVETRSAEVDRRVETQLAAVNQQLAAVQRARLARLDADRFDAIFAKVFPTAGDGAMLPADDTTAIEAYATQVATDAAKATAAATPGRPAALGVAPGSEGVGPSSATGALPPRSAPTAALGGGTPMSGAAGFDPSLSEFTSWSDVRGSYVTDFVTTSAGELGIELNEEERRQLSDPATSHTAAGGASSRAAAAHTPSVPAAGTDMIDLDRLDIEELTKRLYVRVRANLRRELLVDRERVGRLNDVR
jgi:hypothetical protein